MRRPALAALVVLAAGVAACDSGSQTSSTYSRVQIVASDGAGVVLIVAGDIACAPGASTTPVTCHQTATADILDGSGLAERADGAVLLGDIQYESGRIGDFTSFRDSWGAVLGRAGVPIFPTPGNHEWYDPDPPPAGCRLVGDGHNACGYEAFFGDRAFAGDVRDRVGNRGIRLADGDRHPVVLVLVDAGRCEHDPSACARSSPAATFLREALSDRSFNPPDACVVVGWHQARWSDLGHGDVRIIDGLWRSLFSPPHAQRPDLVINGHDHLYERMPPLGVDGRPSPSGIAELIAGAGGREIAGLPYSGPGLERAAFVDAAHFGVVALVADTLHGTITTTFVAEDGQAIDRSAVDCRV